MSPLIQEQVGKALGPLACVLTEHSIIKRWVCPNEATLLGKCIGLYCPICDQNGKPNATLTRDFILVTKHSGKPVNVKLITAWSRDEGRRLENCKWLICIPP
jgi:hypothetical protein